MKPSERRALEAEKRAAREAAERERELSKQTSKQLYTDSEKGNGFNSDAPYKKLPEEEIKVKGDGRHKESFISNHVRLITFIITATVIITVLGPFAVDRLVVESRKEAFGEAVSDKKDLTVEAILILADQGMNLRWSHLSEFNYADFSYEFKDKKTGKRQTRYIREYSIDESLALKVGGYDINAVPDMAQLIDYESGDLLTDIRTGDVSSFLAEHGY